MVAVLYRIVMVAKAADPVQYRNVSELLDLAREHSAIRLGLDESLGLFLSGRPLHELGRIVFPQGHVSIRRLGRADFVALFYLRQEVEPLFQLATHESVFFRYQGVDVALALIRVWRSFTVRFSVL